MSCGGGTKFLVRECNNPVPAHGGNDCDGLPYRVQPCNTCPCELRDWDIIIITYIISISMTEMHAVCIILIKICTIVYIIHYNTQYVHLDNTFMYVVQCLICDYERILSVITALGA